MGEVSFKCAGIFIAIHRNFVAISSKLLFCALGLYKFEDIAEVREVSAYLHHLCNWPLLCKQIM